MNARLSTKATASRRAGRQAPAISRNGNKHEQADRKMHQKWMESAQQLLPVGVWFAVQFDEPGQKKKRGTEQEGRET